MIFIIEEDIVNANDANFLKCFETLLLGYEEGNHLLYIKPKVVDLINEKYFRDMDDRMKRQFIHYEEKFMLESKMAFSLVNYAIQIVPIAIEEKIIEEKTHEIGYLHTDKFLNSSRIQKTILLGENPNDGDIYKIFAKEYLIEKGSSLKVKLKIENGGGNTISPTFIKKIEDGDDLCLCMLDSDKKFPSDTSLGETAKRVIRETKGKMTPKGAYYIEERVRELENILPLDFYYDQYHKDPNKTSIFENFLELEKVHEKFVYFFDMKEGLKHYDVRRYNDWSDIKENIFKDEDSPTCTNDKYCNKKKNCKCTLIKKIGDKVLVDFINFYNNSIVGKTTIALEDFLKIIWNDIGKLVFSWGCGQEPILANT